MAFTFQCRNKTDRLLRLSSLRCEANTVTHHLSMASKAELLLIRSKFHGKIKTLKRSALRVLKEICSLILSEINS